MSNAVHARTALAIITLSWLAPAFGASSFVCGADPAQNTKIVQQAIDNARRVDTIVLPPGVCVVAKCEVANPNAACNGATGKHASALYIGKRLNSQLDIVGDPSGTSVLKLDPSPELAPDPSQPPQRHPYCGDTHVVSVEKISHVTFRGFTIDGSHAQLKDARECQKTIDGKTKYMGFSEHMHGLYLQNAHDIEIVNMQIVNARGDGLNLIADIKLQPLTQGITVRDSKFFGNKRSGIGFQRNVSDVLITGNTFRNSGTDQDLDMESTGKAINDGPTNIDITNNRFERAKAGGAPASGIAVTLGAGNTASASDINFSGNVIVPAPGATTPYGGCVFVYKADNVTIRNNTIIGTPDCYPLQARKVKALTVEANQLNGYRNARRNENGIQRFQPSGVIWVSVDTGKIDAECTGACAYRVHYADGVTIRNNRILQHVKFSSGIELEGADDVEIADNVIAAYNTVNPSGVVDADAHVAAVAIRLGVHPLKEGDFYEKPRDHFRQAWINANALVNFSNAVLIQRYPGIDVQSVSLSRNSLASNVVPAVGLHLKDNAAFVTNLTVDRNGFGCGFVTPSHLLAVNAFVRPEGQAHVGDIGVAIPGNPTPCLKIGGPEPATEERITEEATTKEALTDETMTAAQALDPGSNPFVNHDDRPSADDVDAPTLPTNPGTSPAADCSEEITNWVRAPIAVGAPENHYRVYLNCSLRLNSGDVVQKKLILAGSAASGITVDCNGATIDGGRGAPNDGDDMIQIRSTTTDNVSWQRPTDITVRNCKINGSMRIWGMGKNGEADAVRASSRRDGGHVARLRASAPTRIVLDRLTITATERTPFYLAPGVTYVTLSNSEIKGNATRAGVYFDAESAFNTLKSNYIHAKIFDEWVLGINRLNPQIAIDTSSNNRIIGNRLSGLEGGGIWTYRNCGEGGTVRHGTPSGNQIINNTFFYDKYDGYNPSVYLGSRGQWWRSFWGIGYCDEDDGLPWGSSVSDDDHSTNNVVMQNQVYKLPVDRMIREGDDSNHPNIMGGNVTVTTAVTRLSGCYIADGYKNFLQHGESLDVFKGPDGFPKCGEWRVTCNDGTLNYARAAGCSIQQAPFECKKEGDNLGCSKQVACFHGTRSVGVRAACNLEFGSVSDGDLAAVGANKVKVVRASDSVYSGECHVAGTTIADGEANIVGGLSRSSLPVSCKEFDSNGGDCHIRGTLYCR